MLGRLIELAGPETTVIVVSDHGFKSDDRRPAYIPPEAAGPAVEHRHFGMICMRGPGIKQGETLYGASILDIAPTVLHLFGLPVGRDMDGHVLTTALESAGAVETIASWEDIAGRSGQHPDEARFDPVAANEAIKQLIDLGYVAPRRTTCRRRSRSVSRSSIITLPVLTTTLAGPTSPNRSTGR